MAHILLFVGVQTHYSCNLWKTLFTVGLYCLQFSRIGLFSLCLWIGSHWGDWTQVHDKWPEASKHSQTTQPQPDEGVKWTRHINQTHSSDHLFMDHSGSMTSLNPHGPITGNYLESLMLGMWNFPSFSSMDWSLFCSWNETCPPYTR